MKNKIKQSRSRLISFLTVCVLLLTALIPALTVSAATEIDYTVDDGSITIYKYEGGELLADGVYATQEALDNMVAQAEADRLITPLENVVFTYFRVGTVAQYTTTSTTTVDDVEVTESTTTIGYIITDSALLALLEATDELEVAFIIPQEDDTADTPAGTYYTVSSLDNALDELTQVQINNYTSSASGTPMTETNSDGMTTTGEVLSVGLYLFVETGYPAEVTVTTDPFFISIPTTGYEYDEDTQTYSESQSWVYNVTVYPKNSTSEIKIEKSVAEDGDESDYIDGEIGQAKEFVIRADLPSTMNSVTSFVITDTLSEGLTFAGGGTIRVWGLSADGAAVELTNSDGNYYRFSQDGQGLTFTLVPSDFATDGTNTDYDMIEIRYQAYLNANAVIGGANDNDASLSYTTDGGGSGSAEVESAPGIYTYAISLQKLFDGDTSGNFSEVTFTLYKANDADDPSYDDSTEILVAWSGSDESDESDDGYYYVIGSTGATSVDITPGSDGTIELRGLETGTYYLVEETTADGYNLLGGPIEIKITSTEGQYTISEDGTGTYAQYNSDYFYALDSTGTTRFVQLDEELNGQWVNFRSSEVWYSEDGENWEPLQMYAPEEFSYSATVDGEPVSNDSGTFGTVNVNNQSGFELPATGGSGTFWFVVGGGIVVAIALISLYAVTRKKRSA